MDILTLILIVLIVAAIVAGAFAFARKRQRSGAILAAPESTRHADPQQGDQR